MPHSLYFAILQGQQYFVQVSAYNMKGWGPAQTTTPACASPSSRWWLWTFCPSSLATGSNSHSILGLLLSFPLPTAQGSLRIASGPHNEWLLCRNVPLGGNSVEWKEREFVTSKTEFDTHYTFYSLFGLQKLLKLSESQFGTYRMGQTVPFCPASMGM